MNALSWIEFSKYGLILIGIIGIIKLINGYIKTKRENKLYEIQKAEAEIEQKYNNISDSDLLDIANKRSGSDTK